MEYLVRASVRVYSFQVKRFVRTFAQLAGQALAQLAPRWRDMCEDASSNPYVGMHFFCF